jgi:hypothetical protein
MHVPRVVTYLEGNNNTQPNTPGYTTSPHAALYSLKDEGLKIIVALAYDLEPLLDAAHSLEMLTGEYVWIFPDGAASLDNHPAVKYSQLHGLLSWQNSPRYNSKMAQFREAWAASTVADCSSGIAGVTITDNVFSSSHLGEGSLDIAAYAYDAVAALAVAMAEVPDPENGDDVVAALRNRATFLEGASGVLQFGSEGNSSVDYAGDRNPLHTLYTLENALAQTMWTEVYRTLSRPDVDVTNASDKMKQLSKIPVLNAAVQRMMRKPPVCAGEGEGRAEGGAHSAAPAPATSAVVHPPPLSTPAAVATPEDSSVTEFGA